MRQQEDENNEPAFEVVAVVTQPARRAKRTLEGDAIGGTPVWKIAQQYNIPILCPEKVRNKSTKPTKAVSVHVGCWMGSDDAFFNGTLKLSIMCATFFLFYV